MIKYLNNHLTRIFLFKSLTLYSYTLVLLLLLLLSAGCATTTFCTSQTEKDASPVEGTIHFYRGPLDHLSSVRMGECPMYPSCSEYALEAIHKHGLLLGWFMACDRLMRCGRDELNLSPKIYMDGKFKCLDPIDSNDEWLDKETKNPLQ